MQGLAKYSLKSLLSLVSSPGCFESNVRQGMEGILDTILNVLEDLAVDEQHQQLQILQLRALQVALLHAICHAA